MLNAHPRENEATSWLLVAGWTAMIYASIPLARRIQGFVSTHWGSRFFADVAAAFIVVAVGVMAIRIVRSVKSFSWRQLAWLLGVGGAYVYYLRRLMGNPEEAMHFIQYGVLGLLIYRALIHRMRDRLIFVAAALIAAFLGTLDEVIQWLTPERYWDLRDVFLNTVSASLMLLAVAQGMRPPLIAGRVRPNSARICCRAGLAFAALMLLCLMNTAPRITAYTNRIPALIFIKLNGEAMTEYGHLHADPEIGAFRSRFTLEELRQEDIERGREAAAILNQYRRHDKYIEFLRVYSPLVDPFVHELRVHLFRRDHYLGVLGSGRLKTKEDRGYHAMVAYRENQIVEKYFTNALFNSRCHLRPSHKAVLEAEMTRDAPYESLVSEKVITRFTERQVWWGLILVCLVLALMDSYYGRLHVAEKSRGAFI